jgi:hypothetical protein
MLEDINFSPITSLLRGLPIRLTIIDFINNHCGASQTSVTERLSIVTKVCLIPDVASPEFSKVFQISTTQKQSISVKSFYYIKLIHSTAL